jgi:hypothetical protein
MNEIQLLRSLDPVSADKLDAFPAPDVFAQLCAQLADVPAGEPGRTAPSREARRRWRKRGRRPLVVRSLAAAVAAAVVALAASLAVTAGVAPVPHWALAGEISSSWAQVAGRGPTSGYSLTCPSATTCYAEGGAAVEVSRDEGKSWDPVPTKGETPLSNVACSSTGRCAFVVAGPGTEPMFVWSADAGRTWESRPGPPGLSFAYQLTNGPSGTGPSIGPIDLSCPSASICTLVASSSRGHGAFVTEDGGRTWTVSSTPSAPYQVQCFPDTRCISTGVSASVYLGGAAELRAIYSTDSGLRWSPARVPSVTGWLAFLSYRSSHACMAMTLANGLGAGASLFVSGNGGRSWTPVETQGLPAGKVFAGLACPTASECWLSGGGPGFLGDLVGARDGAPAGVGASAGLTRGLMLSSANGGRTWQSAGLPKGITGVGPLSCPTPSICFALAFQGPAPRASGTPAGPSSLALLVYTAPRH